MLNDWGWMRPQANLPDNLVSYNTTEITPIENSVPSGNNSTEISLRHSMQVSHPPDRLNLLTGGM